MLCENRKYWHRFNWKFNICRWYADLWENVVIQKYFLLALLSSDKNIQPDYSQMSVLTYRLVVELTLVLLRERRDIIESPQLTTVPLLIENVRRRYKSSLWRGLYGRSGKEQTRGRWWSGTKFEVNRSKKIHYSPSKLSKVTINLTSFFPYSKFTLKSNWNFG